MTAKFPDDASVRLTHSHSSSETLMIMMMMMMMMIFFLFLLDSSFDFFMAGIRI